jgi:hypothetical protein
MVLRISPNHRSTIVILPANWERTKAIWRGVSWLVPSSARP